MKSRIARSRFLACAAMAILGLRAGASSLYWDADSSSAGDNITSGAGLGGTGSWGSSANWFDGSNEVPWTAGSDAIFTGTAGTITLAAPQSASSLTFNTTGDRLTGSSLTVGTTSGTFTVNNAAIATIDSQLAGTATFVKSGTGTLVLTNASNSNTVTSSQGGWKISGGTLRLSADGQLGISPGSGVTDLQFNQSTIQAATDMFVDVSRRTKVNTNSSTQNLGDAIIDVNSHNVTWYGSIQGGFGTLRATDSSGNGGMLILGTDKLASINPFGSVLPAGTVNLTVENHVVVQTSGTVTPTGGELGSETGAGGAPLAILLQNGGQIRSESGGYQFFRNLILGPGGGTLDTGAWTQTFSGSIVSGTGSLGKFGTGTLIIDNPSASWSGGTNIHVGTLQLGVGGSNGLLPGTLAVPSNVVIDAGATLRFNRGSNKTFFDIISGAGNVTIANSSGIKVRLVSDNTYTGLTTISSGILMIGQGNAGEPGSIISNVLDNSELDFNRVENITYAGNISGNGKVVKLAAGSLSLTGANTYSSGTDIQLGTLLANNPTGSATGTGPVSISAGATVGGSGTISGSLTLSAGAHLAPGNGAGTLSVGQLITQPSSFLDYELGSTSDLTVVSNPGGLQLLGGTLNITALPGFGIGDYPVIRYTTSFTGSASNLSLGSAPSGYSYSFINNPTTSSIDVVVSPIPEPASLGIFASLICLTSQHHRRRASVSNT